MSVAVRPAPPPSTWRDGLGLFVASLGLLIGLRQRAFHGMDAQYLIGLVRDGEATYYSHKLYLPLMLRWHALLAPIGFSPFESMRAASMLGVALGTSCVHRAGLALGLDRGRALTAAALSCVAPAVLFFGTVVELHGLFHGFAGLAFWQWARCASAPSSPRHLALGVATATAAGVHSSGHLLLALLPMLSAGWRGRHPWQHRAAWLMTLVAHVAATVAWSAVLVPADQQPVPEGTFAAAWNYFVPRLPWSPPAVAAMLWREWGEPFLPLSLVAGAALVAPAQRRRAAALLLGIAPLWGAVWVLLRDELYERGAYLLPFAWPAALLAVEWLSLRLRALTFVVSLALAITVIVRSDHVVDDPTLGAGLRGVLGGAPTFVVCLEVREVEQLHRDHPAVRAWPILSLADAVPRGYTALCTEFDRVVTAEFVAGRQVLLSERAYGLVTGLALPDVQRFARDYLPQRYALESLQARGFAGFALRQRR